jgi:hypothetical protein
MNQNGSEEHDIYDLINHVLGAPVRLFAGWGVLGIPFIFVYWLFMIVAGTALVIGAVWGGVVALMYVLFANV